MDSDSSEDEAPGVELKQSIDLMSVLKGQSFEINFEKVQQQYEQAYEPTENDLKNLLSANKILESDDEEEDLATMSFDELGEKMKNVTVDGKVKKRIRRAGDGAYPPADSMVYIKYSSYLEYSCEPVDCAYIRKPLHFRLGTSAIHGINVAVASMKVNEKSLFLIHSDYAFGDFGHPPRIPAGASFLFHIELVRFVDSGAALEFHSLSPEDRKVFSVAYRTALGLVESAREHFKYNQRLSIRDYNRAVHLLEECRLADMAEQEKQQRLLLRLYTNLAVCYTATGNPKRACCMCNNVSALARGTSLEVPAKVHFHHGRALAMLGEFSRAKDQLLAARALEPHNEEVSRELATVHTQLQRALRSERDFARGAMQGQGAAPPGPNQPNPSDQTDQADQVDPPDDPFQQEVRTLCRELADSTHRTRFRLPGGLTDRELDTAKLEASQAGLAFVDFRQSDQDSLTHYISKK